MKSKYRFSYSILIEDLNLDVSVANQPVAELATLVSNEIKV